MNIASILNVDVITAIKKKKEKKKGKKNMKLFIQ